MPESLDRSSEVDRLESIARDSSYAEGVNAAMIRYCARIFERYVRGDRLLELGPAEGVMTALLARPGRVVTAVDAAESFCRMLRERLPHVNVVQSLFEDFSPVELYPTIVLGHVLEHVDDPVAILRRMATWLTPEGRILAAVPNARSLHRQAGVILGLLSTEDAMSDADRHHGHRRIYNPESFRNDFYRAGLEVEVFGGYFLKTMSARQLEESCTRALLEAYMQLGERHPDIAADIYVVARARSGPDIRGVA